MSEKRSDPVNHPEHYTKYEHEVIELTERMDFCRGNAVKYILRAPFKGKELEDLQKAMWYLKRNLEIHPHFAKPDKTAQELAKTFGNEIVCDIVDDDVGLAIGELEDLIMQKRIDKLEKENELLKKRLQEREEVREDEAGEEGVDRVIRELKKLYPSYLGPVSMWQIAPMEIERDNVGNWIVR